jgi:CRP-like cAMP-binding protein
MTTAGTLDRVFSDHPFFAGLPRADLELLAGCARNERFEAGEFLYRENQPADKFFVVRHGQVRLELYAAQAGPIPILTVGPGDVLGSAWIVPPYRAGCDARALELVRAVSFDGPCMRRKCEQDPRLGYDLMKRSVTVLVDRLMLTRLQLLDLYAGPGERGERGNRRADD